MYPKTTADGSPTAFHPEYQQHYHNLEGAWTETIQLYGRRLAEHLSRPRPGLGLVDLGLGLGYNLLYVLLHWQRLHALPQLQHIYSLDQELTAPKLLALPELNKENTRSSIEPEQAQAMLKELLHHRRIKHNGVTIKLLFGDARQTLQQIPHHSIGLWLWDPFSPYHNPELWTREILALANAKSAPEALLITYSSAVHVRSALQQSSWQVYTIPGIGNKSQATLAYKKPLPSVAQGAYPWVANYSVRERIFFRDPTLRASRESIRQNRLARRARAKRLFPD